MPDWPESSRAMFGGLGCLDGLDALGGLDGSCPRVSILTWMLLVA